MTEKDRIKQEIAERLQWAAKRFATSRTPGAQIARLNRPFSMKLKSMMAGPVTVLEAQRIRNVLGVYKYAVIALTKAGE